MTQKKALKILKSGKNVFLTGPPGSGKTFLLKEFISNLRSENTPVAVTASTGIAATHLEGKTIHSWSGVGVKKELTGRQMSQILKKPYIRDSLVNSEVLIIDEISMMNPEQFALVDLLCRRARNDAAPFGGLQVVLSGDFFQLPPVKSKKFVTETETWQEMDMKICYLDGQYRQIDDKLTRVLQDIRKQKVSSKTRAILEARLEKSPDFDIDPTRLYTHNADVDSINDWELEKLEGKKKEYKMKTKGEKRLVKALKRSSIIPEKLALKKGAQVMFIKNNFKEGYVNGTLGEIVEFGDFGKPIVETAVGKKIEVKERNWRLEEGGAVKAELKQIPLRLAWAITVHKSQGMTLDCAQIDLSSAFERGMGYVALSRIKSLSGLDLRGLNKKALEVSKKAVELDKTFKEKSV